ncbi:MAG: hypothetical protein JW753_11235, partial [Dehalococcoidia bacterium]|nr:hypothetical protein [Dehalococcoidia bacterium]
QGIVQRTRRFLRLTEKGAPLVAIVEVCHCGHEHWYRCTRCETLNINDLGNRLEADPDIVICPDCGLEQVIPEVQMCDCEPRCREEQAEVSRATAGLCPA